MTDDRSRECGGAVKHCPQINSGEAVNRKEEKEALADKIAAVPIGPFAILLGMNDDLHFKEVLAARNQIVAALRASAAPEEGQTGDYDFDNLTDLVTRFSAALLGKLKVAEAKYGHNSGWMRDDWRAACQRSLNEHLAKGDPRDVAAYCAFLWHHGWPTIGPLTPEDVNRVAALPSDSGKAAPVAWLYEMAFKIKPSDESPFSNWKQVVTLMPPPTIPKDGVRNVTPLVRAALAPATEDGGREYGWLIETGDHKYWNGKAANSNGFTHIADDAVRFARFEDSERIIYWLMESYKVFLVSRQHKFIDLSPSPSVGTPAQPSADRETPRPENCATADSICHFPSCVCVGVPGNITDPTLSSTSRNGAAE